MRILDRLINFIFSLVILVLSIVVIMVSAGFIEYNEVDNYIRSNVFSDANNTMACIVGIAFLLASLKTTIFLSRNKNNKKAAIMVDTTHGKVQIAEETIENTAKSAIKDYDEIRDAQVRMVKEKKGVNIYMVLLVLPNTNIIELSAKVQDAVKEAIESTTGVKVNNVDIRVKNITDSKKIKAKEITTNQNVEETVVSEEVPNSTQEIEQVEGEETIPEQTENVEDNNENK